MYFIVAEALTNVVKHAHAGHAVVRASLERSRPRGQADRVTALGGRLGIDSPPAAARS